MDNAPAAGRHPRPVASSPAASHPKHDHSREGIMRGDQAVKIHAEEVLVVASEQARAAAASLGIDAVAIVPGAASPASLPPLLGQRVVLWAANDPAARRHLNRIAFQLRVLGHPADMLRDLVWPEAPPGGDI